MIGTGSGMLADKIFETQLTVGHALMPIRTGQCHRDDLAICRLIGVSEVSRTRLLVRPSRRLQ